MRSVGAYSWVLLLDCIARFSRRQETCDAGPPPAALQPCDAREAEVWPLRSPREEYLARETVAASLWHRRETGNPTSPREKGPFASFGAGAESASNRECRRERSV